MDKDATSTEPREGVEETGCCNCSESVVEVTSSILNGIIYYDYISRH